MHARIHAYARMRRCAFHTMQASVRDPSFKCECVPAACQQHANARNACLHACMYACVPVHRVDCFPLEMARQAHIRVNSLLPAGRAGQETQAPRGGGGVGLHGCAHAPSPSLLAH